MAISPEQKAELLKLQKLVRQYEGIIRTSRNSEQLTRTKRDLKKLYDQIELLSPGGIPDELHEDTNIHKAPTLNEKINDTKTLKLFGVKKCSIHCDEDDINILSSTLQTWETEFSPALSEGHVRLEFSLSQERDSHYALVETSKRTLKTYTQILDDLSRATRDDVKMQLRDMKTRYMRTYLKDTYAIVKKLQDFWAVILRDAQIGGTLCMNPEDFIEFDRRLEKAEFLNNKSVKEAIEIAVSLLQEALNLVHIPELGAS